MKIELAPGEKILEDPDEDLDPIDHLDEPEEGWNGWGDDDDDDYDDQEMEFSGIGLDW